MRSVSRVVPTQVNSGQTVVSHGHPGLPGLASATQVEAISRTVMAQMSEMFAAFQTQISDLTGPRMVNVNSSILVPQTSSAITGYHGQV